MLLKLMELGELKVNFLNSHSRIKGSDRYTYFSKSHILNLVIKLREICV